MTRRYISQQAIPDENSILGGAEGTACSQAAIPDSMLLFVPRECPQPQRPVMTETEVKQAIEVTFVTDWRSMAGP
jgi:hypothetical protein